MAETYGFTTQAVQDAAVLIQSAWIAAADALRIAPHDQAAYVAGLLTPQSLVYPDGGDPFAARVVNVARQAARIELGTPALHLPTVIRWAQSRAARRSKAGRWYLRIPFRHYAARVGGHLRPSVQQAMMPASVYRVARRLRPGERLTAGPSRGQARHARGMQPYVPREALNVRLGYARAARQEGLRRDTRRRGTYLSFRTMTQASPGWWLPAKPGVHLRDQVERAMAPRVQALIEAAVQADVEVLLGQRGRG